MNINNIAIVRATNIIPTDGIVKPISESSYIKKNTTTDFSSKMIEFLKNAGIIPPIDYSNLTEESMKEHSAIINKIVGDYIPYTSDYNSMVLFSLNGIVPDDSEMGFGNNTFSNKKCAIIDGLNEHIDNVTSLMPTDTAIKGSVHLSSSAIILIEEETYANLPEINKQQLSKLSINIKLFTGNLKDAVLSELSASNRYIPEMLSLSRNDQGFVESTTSEEQKRAINELALTHNIPQVLFFNVITREHDYEGNERLSEVNNEFENSLIVEEYYMERFYQYMLVALKDRKDLKELIPKYMRLNMFLDEFFKLIESFGVDNYKIVVAEYNKMLELEKENETLLTPEEIVIAKKESSKNK
jgi:hypothetical protein